MWKLSFLMGLLALGLVSSLPNNKKISSDLLLKLGKDGKANIFVDFLAGTSSILNSIESQRFANRGEKLTILKSALYLNAVESQQNVLNFLQQEAHISTFKSFWISNQISIKNADLNLVQKLASFPEISKVNLEVVASILPVTPEDSKPSQVESWGLTRIQVEQAWNVTNGTGVVVAGIDTGVRHTHEALRSNFRSDLGWLDPIDGSFEPNDDISHGTHTMGTIVGSHGIGVAPGATWIACKGCIVGCDQEWLLTCAQWVMCPYRPDGTGEDCSKAAHVVSNSWGGPGGSTWFESAADAWIAAGIAPVFAQGNQGPECGTSHNPGNMERVIAVGSIEEDSSLSRFSSAGPTTDGRLKPEVTAPGGAIYSAMSTDDAAYGRMSGTSMATPHVSGVTALLLSLKPNLTFYQVKDALTNGTDTNVWSQNRTCGGRDDSTFPNNHFGHGVVSALKVVESALVH